MHRQRALPTQACMLMVDFAFPCRLHGYGGFAWDREYTAKQEEEKQLLLNAEAAALIASVQAA